ncbi:MAG: dihydroorotate dehydrogenase electron transfer subunit [Lachnospiraceae bacterium]|nr:dihydroorotate dehydrogenase electron transfer subunit [Lachnospiraceae bacterium]
MAKTQSLMTIVKKEKLSEDIYRLKLLYGADAKIGDVIPGQFVGVYSPQKDKLLPRPVSICDFEKDERLITLVFRTAGCGTKEIAACGEGDELKVLGILGNGYDIDRLRGKKTALLGGGIGIPPMLYLAKQLSGISDVTCYMGYRDSRTFLLDEFRAAAETVAATEDGSVGVKGNVLDALASDAEKNVLPEAICACGPLPMLRAVQRFAAERDILCFLSLEERMACGVGACLGCVCRTSTEDEHFGVSLARVCTDGPVFEQSRVVL